jgi:signal transduction histidine kinase
VAKPLSANREDCALASLARRAVRDTVCKYAGQVHIEVPPNDVRVSVDPELVLRFLNNVLANATWAAGADGEVTVRARVEVDPHGEWVVIDVEDSGPGFAPAVLDHLFEPFVTTRADGTGLGLITMREVCRLHGGDLSVTNRPQGGALVTARMLSR